MLATILGIDYPPSVPPETPVDPIGETAFSGPALDPAFLLGLVVALLVVGVFSLVLARRA